MAYNQDGLWVIFGILVTGMIIFDLSFYQRLKTTASPRINGIVSVFYVAVGLLFSLVIGHAFGANKAQDYLTAFIVEKSLSLDNIFVISVIFQSLSIPEKYQRRVLFYGFLGMIVLRGIMIMAGSHLVQSWSWVLHFFGVLLVLTGIKMLFIKTSATPLSESPLFKTIKRFLPMTEKQENHHFWVKSYDASTKKTRWMATPLFLALIMVEISDILFAVDSIPAVFAVTQDLVIVYSSNIFALLGLRALYSVFVNMVHRISTLKPTLAVLLIFIGSKGFIAHIMGLGMFPSSLSMSISLGILCIGLSWGQFLRKTP